jgi:hypothetical protein
MSSTSVIKPPITSVIKPPRHAHRFWSATRARLFARKLTGDPKRRSTYDQNIRLIAAKTHPDVDPRDFIQKVNPVLWCLAVGWSQADAYKLLKWQWLNLWQRCAYSRCDHCRLLANRYSGYYFAANFPPLKPCPYF